MYSKDVSELPKDIWQEVLKFRRPETYAKMAQVNKKLRLVALENWLWKEKFQKHFPYYFQIMQVSDDTNWYAEFVQAYIKNFSVSDPFNQTLYFFNEGVGSDPDEMGITLDNLYKWIVARLSHSEWMVIKNNPTIVDYLYRSLNFQRGSVSYENGRTPLHWAIISHQSIETMKPLMDDINEEDTNEYTPLYMAVESGQLEIVHYLLENKAAVEHLSFKKAPLYAAAKNGRVDIFEVLLKYGADIDQVNENSCLHDGVFSVAAKYGQFEILKTFIMDIRNLDILPQYTILVSASKFGHIHIVNFLLKEGGDGGLHFGAIRSALENGHSEIVKILLTKDAGFINMDVTYTYTHTLLSRACLKRDLNIVNVLLSFQADVNQPCIDGRTPLHIVAQSGEVEILKALLNTNLCHLDVKNRFFGQTPLELAKAYGHKECVFLLKRQKLVHYLKQNEQRANDDYHGRFSFFGPIINLSYCLGGYSALEKREAAKALLDALDGKEAVDLQPHKGALTNGVLELVYDSLKEYLPDEYREDKSCFIC